MGETGLVDLSNAKAVLFDLDGTLISSAEAYYEIMEQTCQSLGLSVPDWKTTMHAMNTGEDFFSYIFSTEQLQEREFWVDKFRQQHQQIWRPIFLDKVKLIEGIDKTLEKLRSNGISLGIVTSSSREILHPLEESGLIGFFDVIVTKEDVNDLKPNPEPVQLAANLLGIDPGEAVLVGDTPLDIAAGQAAGTKTIGVLSGTSSRLLLQDYHPDHIIPDATYLTQDALYINGIQTSGLNTASEFTQLPWFQLQILDHFKYHTYPGTFNLTLDKAQSTIFQSFILDAIHSGKAAKIIPENEYCDAYCIPVHVEANSIVEKGAVVYPMVEGYPNDKLEIVSPVFLKHHLGIDEGDKVHLYLMSHV